MRCAPGFTLMKGDIGGWGRVGGRGAGQKVPNCGQCASFCMNQRGNCNSYECSPTELRCNLNRGGRPTTSKNYKDYAFCSRGGGRRTTVVRRTTRKITRRTTRKRKAFPRPWRMSSCSGKVLQRWNRPGQVTGAGHGLKLCEQAGRKWRGRRLCCECKEDVLNRPRNRGCSLHDSFRQRRDDDMVVTFTGGRDHRGRNIAGGDDRGPGGGGGRRGGGTSVRVDGLGSLEMREDKEGMRIRVRMAAAILQGAAWAAASVAAMALY